MFRATRVALSVVVVLCVDVLAYATRSVQIANISVLYLLAPTVATLGLVALLLISLGADKPIPIPATLPEGAKARGQFDSPAVMAYILTSLARQGQQGVELQASLDELTRFFQETERRNQRTQLRLALATTLIGLMGGWLPIALTGLASSFGK